MSHSPRSGLLGDDVDGGVLCGFVLVFAVEHVALTARQRDVVVAGLRCLQRAGLGLLELRCTIRLLFAEAVVERVAAIFVDVVQPARQRGVLYCRVVLVADHLSGVGLAASQRGVGVGGCVVPRQVFGMLAHGFMMEERFSWR